MNLKSKLSFLAIVLISLQMKAQLSPAITSWLHNNTATGTYYTNGNSTAASNGVLVNCQQVQYSNNFVYVSTKGIPAYPTGPFLDGNPSVASTQNAIFKFPLNPTQNTGTATNTTGGNIGVFINGVALFDYRDGVAWNSTTNTLCGGLPGLSPCPGGPGSSQSWNRDAILAERGGFDCAKGHPAQGNYHHHQNPSAFKFDINTVSTVCNLYDADGLYVPDSTAHSPLIGFAYDGFPIYGAYAYKNADGTGGVTRIKSGFQLRNITARIIWADGTDVPDGPIVSTTYPLGYFREDYEFISHPNDPDYLDVHNGRFCVTPEYPNGTYCYFATVDANWNSAYPYVVGPTFYGVKTAAKVTSVTETTTNYIPNTTSFNEQDVERLKLNAFVSKTTDFIAVQVSGLLKNDLQLFLYSIDGKIVATSKINAGSSNAYFDIQTLYNGVYVLKANNASSSVSQKLVINRE
jgi:hypothetical protein